MAKTKTWAELKMEELNEKGKRNWSDDDYEAYNYIKECEAEDERDAEYLGAYSFIF